jgi:hypothetical protein
MRLHSRTIDHGDLGRSRIRQRVKQPHPQSRHPKSRAFRKDLGPFVVAAETTRMAMVFTDAKEANHPLIFANGAFVSNRIGATIGPDPDLTLRLPIPNNTSNDASRWRAKRF